MKDTSIIILISLFLTCCQSKKNIEINDVDRIEINVDKFVQKIDISKYYTAKFIPLELTPKSRIGAINKVIVKDNYIYVLDNERANKVFKFDIEGRFIKTIGKNGAGIAEYLVLGNFDVTEDIIYISSQQNNKMLKFDLEGKHIKDIRYSGYIGMDFQVLDEKSILTRSGDLGNKSATFYNQKGKVKKIVTNPEFPFGRYSNTQCFIKFKNDYFIYFALNDTIYQIDNTNRELKSKYVVDFGTKKFPLCDIQSEEDLVKINNSRKYLHLSAFALSNNLQYLEVYQDLSYYIIVDKESKKTLAYGNSMFYDELHVGSLVGSTDCGPILTWYPSSIPNYKKKLNKEFDFVPKSCLNATVNANPGIVILSEKINDEN